MRIEKFRFLSRLFVILLACILITVRKHVRLNFVLLLGDEERRLRYTWRRSKYNAMTRQTQLDIVGVTVRYFKKRSQFDLAHRPD